VLLLFTTGSACGKSVEESTEAATDASACAVYEEACGADECCVGLACVEHPDGARCEADTSSACSGRGERCADGCCPGLSCYSDSDETWYCDDADKCLGLGSSCDGSESQFPCCGTTVCAQGICQETYCADWGEPCSSVDCCDGLTCHSSSEEHWSCEPANSCIALGSDCDIEPWPCCDGGECNGYSCQTAGCMGVREPCNDDCCEGLVCDHGPQGPGDFGACQPAGWCTPLGDPCDDDTPKCCSGGECIDGACEFTGDTDDSDSSSGTTGDHDPEGTSDTTGP
jgi:hypothetical protein